jgi:DNA-directed RNA polymerase subunit RPC12/RpoP
MVKLTKEQVVSKSIPLFVKWNEIKNEVGIPINFHNHPFLFDIYKDLSPKQVLLKAPQVGATVMNIVKSFWVAKYLKKDIVYTLPSFSDVNDMVGGKINRIIAQNPIFMEWVKDHDTVAQKNVGDNQIYYRGTWSTKQAMMVSSDLNIHDEVDASKEDVITQYETRLQAKAGGWQWYFSHPLLPNSGVDKYWQLSDQKEWFVICPQCGKKQYLKFPDNIDMDRGIYICRNCKKELSDDDRRRGKWVQKYKNREYSGYHISQMMCPWISAQKIIDDYKTKDEQYFYNYVLGLPYVGGDNSVSEEVIYQNITGGVHPQRGRIIIGLDTGLPSWFVMGNEYGLFYNGSTNDYETTMDILLQRYPKAVLFADQGGDLIGIRKLREKYKGRVFLVHYRTDRKTYNLMSWGKGEEYGNVIVDRNRMIQIVIDELKEKRIPLYGTKEDWAIVAKHFSNIYRVAEENGLGVKQYKWERNGDDHTVHSIVYFRVGMARFGGTQEGNIISSNIEGVDEIKEVPRVGFSQEMKAPDIDMKKILTSQNDDWRL